MSLPAFGSEGPVLISPSKMLCVWIALVTTTAVALCAVYLPGWIAIVASLLCVCTAIHMMRRDALLTALQSIVSLRFGYSHLDFQCKNGSWHAGKVIPSSFVSRWLSIVAIRTETASRRHIILMPDSLNGDVRRWMRVWLKWSQIHEAGADVK